MAYENQYTRILFVDYASDYYLLLKDAIDQYGGDEFQISYYEQSFKQAVAIARQYVPDVAIVAQTLLDVTGMQVIEQIKRESPNTICYLLTDRAPDITIQERAAALGALKVLRKPDEAEVPELLELIKNDLGEQRYARQHQSLTTPKSNGSDLFVNTRIQSIRKTVISINSPKGGVGKTSAAVNMAVAAAQQKNLGVNVAIVDLNEFGNVTTQLNLGPPEKVLNKHGLQINLLSWQYIKENATLKELQEYMAHHESGLWVVPSVTQPSQIHLITQDFVRKTVTLLRNHFDLVILDCPPSISLDVSWAATDIADYIILVVTPDAQLIGGMKQIRATLDNLGVSKKCYRLVNLADIKGGLRIRDLEKHLPYEQLGELPEDFQVRQGVTDGRPIALSDPNGHYMTALKAALNKVFPVFTNQGYKPDKKKAGLFGRFKITQSEPY